MPYSLTFTLALLLAVGLSACDAIPSATASSGAADTDPFELREDVVVASEGGEVHLVVAGQRISLAPVEMFALSQVAHRASWDALSDEQRDIYLAGERSADPPGGKGGGRCYPDPDGEWTFAGRGGGGTDPCPPPPPMRLSRELAGLFYGDYFDVGDHPGENADWRPVAGGLYADF